MKSKKYTRQIQTTKGTGNGIQSLTIHTPESDKEWENACARADDVRLSLRQIIESASERLNGLPGTQEAYQLTPDGGWVSVEAEVAEGKKVLYWQRGYSPGAELLGTGPSLPIEHASPQEFAWFAREDAEAALQALDDGDMIQAVSNAMNAVNNWRIMDCIERHELGVVREQRSAEGLSKGGGKRKVWAEELAQWLHKKYPDKAVTPAMIQQRLPVGKARPGDPEYAGYQVWRHTDEVGDKAELMAHNELTQGTDSLKWGTFRQRYLEPIRKA